MAARDRVDAALRRIVTSHAALGRGALHHDLTGIGRDVAALRRFELDGTVVAQFRQGGSRFTEPNSIDFLRCAIIAIVFTRSGRRWSVQRTTSPLRGPFGSEKHLCRCDAPSTERRHARIITGRSRCAKAH